jgi:hypothetical protein
MLSNPELFRNNLEQLIWSEKNPEVLRSAYRAMDFNKLFLSTLEKLFCPAL